MRGKHLLAVLGAICAGAMSACADTPVAESSAYSLDIDTVGSPYVVTSIAEPVGLPYRVGDTITLTAPDGAASTPVASATAVGTDSWTATAGGVWTFSNSGEGATVEFVVRYSIFGTQGAGTVSDPMKIVDGEELAYLIAAGTAHQDSMLSLVGPAVFKSMPRLSGYAIVPYSDGIYRLAASAGGLAFESWPLSLAVDTRQPGPDRKVRAGMSVLPFAYSGDGWVGSESADCSLTFAPSSGASTTVNLTGTGVYRNDDMKVDDWTVTLVAGDISMSANITFAKGLIISIE